MKMAIALRAIALHAVALRLLALPALSWLIPLRSIALRAIALTTSQKKKKGAFMSFHVPPCSLTAKHPTPSLLVASGLFQGCFKVAPKVASMLAMRIVGLVEFAQEDQIHLRLRITSVVLFFYHVAIGSKMVEQPRKRPIKRGGDRGGRDSC